MRSLLLILPLCALAAIVPLVGRAETPKPKVRLVSESDEKMYRSFLPKTADMEFEQLKARHLIFYTEKQMPKAYQKWEGGVVRGMAGIHDPYYNISGTADAYGVGNTNMEFPWKGPAGLDITTNTKNFKFVYLPAAIDIKREQLASPRLGPDEFATITWIYPEGTVFGEVLQLTDDDKRDWTFEVRTRTKIDGKWDPKVYRPFPTLESLQKALTAMYSEDSAAIPEGYASSFMTIKAGKPAVPTHKYHLRDDKHVTRNAVNAEATEWMLPKLPKETVQRLLKETTFQKDFGDNWYKGEPYAVNSQSDFNVVPKGYTGGYFAVGKNACMTCHEGTLKHADDFDRGREWYGRVRGSDNIFSFHPFAVKVISPSGVGLGVQWRQELLDADLLVEKRK